MRPSVIFTGIAAALTGQLLPLKKKNILVQLGMNDTRNARICSFDARSKIAAAVIMMWRPDESGWMNLREIIQHAVQYLA